MLQLNAKEMKNFRDTVAKWHIANFDAADARITKGTVVASYKKLIATNEDIVLKSKDQAEIAKRKDEITSFIAKMEEEEKRINAHIKAAEPNLKAGRELLSNDLMDAIENYLDNIYDDDAEVKALEAIAKWFTENGAVGVVPEDVRKFLRPIGKKVASARKMCETNRHTSRDKGVKLKDAFLGALCDDENFIKLLPVYSWTNKIEKKAKKADK